MFGTAKPKSYLLETTVFVCGAVVMVFELVGSRVVGPTIGTSTYVWTSLIGVILGSLSVGYWWGGKMADKKADRQTLSVIIMAAALLMIVMIFSKEGVLAVVSGSGLPLEAKSVLIALMLFAPVSVLMGIVSPYTVKLRMEDMRTSGATVGNLYAISTAGSIFGTFFAGFWLIPHLGTVNNLYLLAAVLALTSIAVERKRFLKTKIAIICLILLSAAVSGLTRTYLAANSYFDVDSEYNRILVYKSVDRTTKRPILALLNDPFGTQSAMFLNNDELVFNYTKFYDLAGHFKPDLKNALMIGGCAYSYPKHYLERFPEAALDVVEIDPKMTALAKEHFRLPDTPRLDIYHEDARVFLNETLNKYDIIFGDAFNSSATAPFQLTTVEAVRKISDALNPDGVAVLNIIASMDGDKGRFLRAEYATYKAVFPQVLLFPVTDEKDANRLQNVMLVAFKSNVPPDLTSADPEISGYLSHLWTGALAADLPILTDDFAPVEYYMKREL